MSVLINRSPRLERQILLVRASNLTEMKPFCLSDSADGLLKLYNMGIETFNPNIVIADKGKVALKCVIGSNTIVVIETKKKMCMLHLHFDQMRQYKAEILKKIHSIMKGPYKITVIQNDISWNVQPFLISMVYKFEEITKYEVQDTLPGSTIIVY